MDNNTSDEEDEVEIITNPARKQQQQQQQQQSTSNLSIPLPKPLKRMESEVIILSDSDSDEEEEKNRVQNKHLNRTISQPNPITSSESDLDLPDFSLARQKNISLGRSKSDSSSIASTSTLSNSSKFRPSGLSSTHFAPPPRRTTYDDSDDEMMASPPLRKATSKEKGKGKEISRTEVISIDSSPPTSPVNVEKRRPVVVVRRQQEVEVEDDDSFFISKKVGTKRKKTKSPSPIWSDEDDDDDDVGISAPRTKKAKASTSSSTSATALKAQQSLVVKAQKETLKLQKAAEAAEKKRITSVNTLRSDRKASVGDMTVRCSGWSFRSSEEQEAAEEQQGITTASKKSKSKPPSPWLSITSLLQTRLQNPTSDNQQPCSVLTPELPRLDVGSEGAIRWTRVCDRIWNMEKERFDPLAEGERIVVEEDSRVIFITAQTLSTEIASSNLLAYIQDIKSKLPSHISLFFLVYGLHTLFNKLKNSQAEVYRNRIRNGDDPPLPGVAESSTNAKGKGKQVGIGENQPDRETIELELMRVQVATKCFLIHVEKEEEAVTWLEQLTLDVGHKPYQRYKMSSILSLGTADQSIQTGKDAQDTYIKMLSTLKGITEHSAKGIVQEYPTIRDLYQGWEKCPGGLKGRREMLVGICKNSNKDGTASNRMIGAALSTLVYKVFCGKDPGEFI